MSLEVKCELEGSRVKGISFHELRSWLLVSFHTGDIIIYDYDAEIVVQKYAPENKVACRAVDFHPVLPIFASGSDDNCVRLYDYERERIFMTFRDHLDYIRTVSFHRTQPLLISSSDDQTCRIWNFETNQCVSILSGHNHYCMSAFFHPTEPLVITGSLDDSVRVWSINAVIHDKTKSGRKGPGIFALRDAILLFQQEEHISGVNWAQWHPSKPYAVSCSDDQSVKLWKLGEKELTNIATLRSHSNNVSCAVFHPTLDVVISVSEDKTVRLWDFRRYVNIGKYRRAGKEDRFWVAAIHPQRPLFAAGHDSGLTVFRLRKERPAYVMHKDALYFYNNERIHKYKMGDQNLVSVATTKPYPTGKDNRPGPLDPPPKRVQYCEAHDMLLVAYTNKFEIHKVGENAPLMVISGTSPIWVSRNEYGWLQSNTVLCVRELNSDTVKKTTIPSTNYMFPGVNGCIYLATAEEVILYDVLRKQIVARNPIPYVKYAYMSPCKKYIAFIGNTAVTIAAVDLSTTTAYQDTMKIKSGAWHRECFMYSTANQIKYFMPTGEQGLVKGFSKKVYIAAVYEKELVCIGFDGVVNRWDVDLTEVKFKLAIWKNDMATVTDILRHAKITGETMIQYLERVGRPEIAINYIENPERKFTFAIDAGDLEAAVEAAAKINQPATWDVLADVAMMQGRFTITEAALRKSGNDEKLAFFYLISGQIDRLKAMSLDPAMSLQRAIWLNERGTEADLLQDTAPALSYIAAKTSGYDEFAEALGLEKEMMDTINASIEPGTLSNELNVTGVCEDWPLLYVSKPVFEVPKKDSDMNKLEKERAEALARGETDLDDAWADSDDGDFGVNEGGEEDGDGDGWDVAMDIDDVPDQETGKTFVPPIRGDSVQEQWRFSHIPGELAAAGLFGQALTELQGQIGLRNAEPLKDAMISCYTAANGALQMLAGCPSVSLPICEPSNSSPSCGISLEALKAMRDTGFVKTRAAKFEDALRTFRELLQMIPLKVCATKAEENEIKALIKTCQQYIIGLEMQLQVKTSSSASRKVELAAYFTHCQLEKLHNILTLKNAINIARKNGFLAVAISVARRLADISPSEENSRLVRSLEATRKKEGKPDPQINYDERQPFDVCCGSMTPIYRGTAKSVCPFCGACYKTEFKGTLCKVCDLCEVGADVSGLAMVRRPK